MSEVGGRKRESGAESLAQTMPSKNDLHLAARLVFDGTVAEDAVRECLAEIINTFTES